MTTTTLYTPGKVEEEEDR